LSLILACQPSLFTAAIDDPHKTVKVIASEGKSGETKEISYSNCKVIGNGSFGVVYQAKLVGAPKDAEDIAIKKVLQDKRFKVCSLRDRLSQCRVV
jgi:glycogen synthase kinase 3 beta